MDLHTAAAEGDLTSCRALLDLGDADDANEHREEDGATPLSLACRYAHLEVCQLLIERGANVNVKGLDGRTPLFWAAASSSETLCEMLLNAGAKPLPPGCSPSDIIGRDQGNGKPRNMTTPVVDSSQSSLFEACSSKLVYFLGCSAVICYAVMCSILFSTQDQKPLYTLDTDLTWNLENAVDKLSKNLGPSGIEKHLRLNRVDHVFPFLYAPLLALVHAQKGNSVLFVALSGLAGLLDVVENRVVRAILLAYPEQLHESAYSHDMIHLVTPTKFAALGLSIIALVLQYLSESICWKDEEQSKTEKPKKA